MYIYIYKYCRCCQRNSLMHACTLFPICALLSMFWCRSSNDVITQVRKMASLQAIGNHTPPIKLVGGMRPACPPQQWSQPHNQLVTLLPCPQMVRGQCRQQGRCRSVERAICLSWLASRHCPSIAVHGFGARGGSVLERFVEGVHVALELLCAVEW